ncbi:MAG: cytochrome c peroxidase [Bacteroidia bacterium]
MKLKLISVLSIIVFVAACNKETDLPERTDFLEPYILQTPAGFPAMQIPTENPLTKQGVELGRKLFYDPILSGNNTMSCGTCHVQEFGFTDNGLALSIGIDGIAGTRNSMPVMNLGWDSKFFWDGGAADLESQVIGPIQNPVEMHEDLSNAIAELNAHPEYPALFKQVFGESPITSAHVMKAIAQFERTLISGNSKYDKYLRGEAVLTPQELQGMDLFTSFDKGDCSHCHVLGSTFTDFEFKNNGLDSVYADEGRYRITLNPDDLGRFKTPSLRNIEVTAPYMHDGRFSTLMEVIQHYNSGFANHPKPGPINFGA